MSNSIVPWIATYLVGVAEEYGANTASIPWFTKKKKVQIIEVSMNFPNTCSTPTHSQFLTYGEDEVIWGKISDKDVSIHIRFNKDAVADYNMFVIASYPNGRHLNPPQALPHAHN